jgi:hypothetical protein
VAELNSSTRVMLKITRIDVVTAGFPCQGVSMNNVARDGFNSEVLISLLHVALLLHDAFVWHLAEYNVCMYFYILPPLHVNSSIHKHT